MKNLNSILFLATLFTLLFSACKKEHPHATHDPCESLTCLNGGVCDNGTCDCPSGYSGPLCATHDPCESLICLNGGVCDNGTCDCPSGYSGSDCSDTLASTKMTITKITVTNYPVVRSNGNKWDVADGADAFVSFSIGTTASNSGYRSETINNVTGSTLEYSKGLPTSTQGAHNIDWTIGFWDEDDFGIREFMTSLTFRPDANSDGNPSTIVLRNNDLTITLDVTWEY